MWRNALYIHSFLYCEQRAFCPHAHIRRLCSIQSVPDDIYSLSKKIQYGNDVNLCRYETVSRGPIASSFNRITDRQSPYIAVCCNNFEITLRFGPIKQKYRTWEVITKVTQCSLVVRRSTVSEETSASIYSEVTASRLARNVAMYTTDLVPHNRNFNAFYSNGIRLG